MRLVDTVQKKSYQGQRRRGRECLQLLVILADKEVQEVESMLVKDLKAELRHREACVTGVKEDLVERLLELLMEKRRKRLNQKKVKLRLPQLETPPISVLTNPRMAQCGRP